MALSGKLDEVGEADRWIWERLGRIWERLGCWTGSSQQPRRLIKTQILLAENLLEQGVGGALSNGIVGFIAIAAGMTGNATAADMTSANIHTFEVCVFYVPLDLIVLSLLVFMFKVKINEKMHAEIVEQLEAKLAAGEIPDEEVKTVRRLKRQREGQDSDRINNQYLPLLPFSLMEAPISIGASIGICTVL